ncbi:kinesin-like protein KIN-14J isoform X2 [Asparagus officinalis]|uniref:kinesin-like protein KIN-14J isoform X2 n=1 Tax=Asparagus officinalis TaxID=4686 RepID=UPI00098E1F55|nr:kinesin-like protein KIN-14J isoform X2 [Asparagus officinalis]
MGEESLPMTPLPQPSTVEEITIQDGTPIKEDSPFPQSSSDEEIMPEEETSQENGDIDEKGRRSIQEHKDDSVIPSPVLKGESITSFFGPDLTSALQLLGTKYNNLVKKCQEQTAETDQLRANCELLRNKCIQECEPKYEALKKKYTRECSERKRLYNEIIELKGNIRVFCRCRPLSSEEISKGYASVVEFDPSQDSELHVVCSDNSKKQFKFDHVFSPKDNQEIVFAETLPVVKSVLDGYNVCIFAYGQTGTGKTFTMEGTPENRGVNYRALEELFRSSIERSSMIRYEFLVSMLEVYNEKIRDLLTENSDQPAKRLEVRQLPDGSQDVPGLVEAQACNIDEVWEILKTGGRNRSVGSTNANELSSRSHCLVRLTVMGENLIDKQRSRSHMWLVDLAGSERVGKTEVEGERLKESQFINKSLSALGDVISALASKNPHIPYRNSKLTHLLQSSLGGDCKTLMFTQISPSSADLGETLCSLNFASRVRGIEYGPARKQSDPQESFKLKQMAEKLRQEEKETGRLNESLQLMQLKYASRENVFKTLQDKIRDAEQACRNYQMKVRDLENQLADQKKGQGQIGNREPAKYTKPPLVPIRERQPLSRITNRLPPPGPRRSTMTTTRSFENKENIFETKKNVPKARRISLSPIVRSIPVQPKRRASIAILPSEAERRQPQHTNSNSQFSRLRIPRRMSVTSFAPPAPGTPLATPGSKSSRFSSFLASSSKYSSPPNMQAVWKSKIPTFASPRNRLQLHSSPTNSSCANNATSLHKLCFSVQKRVIVGSPAAQPKQHPVLLGSSLGNRAFQSKDSLGRYGTAQRVACKNRRQSVI